MKKLIQLNNYCRLFVLIAVLLLDTSICYTKTCDSTYPALGRWELVHILRRDGFSNVIDEYTELNRIGNIKVASSCFTLIVYSREFKAGSNLHATTRLLIIRDHEYLGMYTIDESPTRIKGNTVEFPGKESEGRTIVFSGTTPPDNIFLGGEMRSLFK